MPTSGTFSQAALADAGLSPRFEDQHRAEEWLQLYYCDLLDQGVAELSLREEDRVVYGPMSLEA